MPQQLALVEAAEEVQDPHEGDAEDGRDVQVTIARLLADGSAIAGGGPPSLSEQSGLFDPKLLPSRHY